MNLQAALKTFLTLCAMVFIPIVTSSQLLLPEPAANSDYHWLIDSVCHWVLGALFVAFVLSVLIAVYAVTMGIYVFYCGKNTSDQLGPPG